MLPIEYFKAINGALDTDSFVDSTIAEAKMSLREELISSINYIPDAKRNGIQQGFVVTPSNSRHKYEIQALPDEELFVGDLIECRGEMWIVTETQVGSPLQTIGLMWLCNYQFRWQNGTSDIIERWGVLDSGVYSTTKDGNSMLMTPDKQYKIYLPYDSDTKQLFIDKRIATEVLWDKAGDVVLGVYTITGYDSVSNSYGKNGHLLVLNARSADYVPGVDSVEEMICDYIVPTKSTSSTDFNGTITGRNSVRLGVQRKYSADFDVSSWDITPPSQDVEIVEAENSIILSVGVSDELIGEVFSIVAYDMNGNQASMSVEVTN